MNLLTNAVKFSPGNRPVEVSLAQSGGSVEFDVRDYGQGVPEEKRETIFSLFQQVHHEDAVVGGLGVGLYVSREIVTAHGGTIHVEPAEGAGSHFVVRLPAPAPTAATAEVVGPAPERALAASFPQTEPRLVHA